jgi:hypothetical protein
VAHVEEKTMWRTAEVRIASSSVSVLATLFRK